MSANTGKDFEKVVRDIYQDILKLDGVSNVNVKHNVVFPGRTGAKHQIDVFWEFVLAGIRHTVIIQAKDWTSAVDQGEVLKFIGVLNDLPGQPRGVMVARSGFQKGALTIAEDAGLVLYECREVRESDFVGLLKSIDLRLKVFIPQFHAIEILWDTEWIREQQISVAGAQTNTDDLLIVNSQGERLKSLTELLHELIEPAYREYDWKSAEITFDEDRFLETRDGSYPRIKILGLRAKVKVTSTTRERKILYTDMFQRIFASVTGGEAYLVGVDGKVTRRA